MSLPCTVPGRFALVAFSIGSLFLAENVFADNPIAPSAQRYGELMAQHWMVADLVQQIERASFYQTNRFAKEVDRLEQSVSETEERLDQARGLYKKLFKKEVTDHSEALFELLNSIAASDTQNERDAELLLETIGKQTGGRKFQALPISNEAIEPAWNPKLIGKNFQPTRIIFGCTGEAGDDRTLPLKFDFGKAGLGADIQMKAPGELDLSKGFVERTDSIFPWMQKYHKGWHYWAGVYNNQNTYVAEWFLKLHEKDDDTWVRLIDGKIPSRGGFSQVNIWNTNVQSYLRDYCAAQGRTLRSDPSLVCYDYTAEPHPFGSLPPGQPQYTGYNDSAVAAFHEFLEKKFKTIEALNIAWHSSYKSFSVIQPPPDPYVTPQAKASPLSWEFEQFRVESHTRVWKMCYDAYRKNDPAKPIVANASQFMSGWPVEALDAYGMQKAGVADWIDMHMNNFPPNLPEQIYLYSLCRLTGKVPVQFEYVWTFPRTKPFDDNSESDFRATCTASIWRNLVWGKKVFVFFDFYYDWPAYHNAFLDRDLEYSILRPSGCVIPAMKRKALRFNDLFINTEVANPPIAVLQPTASVWNSPSLHPNQSFSYHIGAAQHGVHDLLFPKNYPFLYVPEEAVLNDGYDLKKHKVLILPQAPYLPARMTEKLLAWVQKGGTLISLGVPGIWNEYGADDLRLVTKVFGKSKVTDAQPGKWDWRWEILEKKPDVKVVNDGANSIGASARFGKGKVLVSTSTFGPVELQKLFFEETDRAIGRKPFSCAKNLFELVLREDKRGHKFLFVLNPHNREVREDQITVAGKFSKPVDLGVGAGVAIPSLLTKGETHFALRLQPGEGTVVELKN